MRKIVFMLFSLVTLVVAFPALAQGEILTGPLIALNTPAQNKIVLYDITAQTTRELSFAGGGQRVWGFSPDGCRVLFTMNRATQNDRLYSARLDGTDVQELVTYTDLPPDAWSVWDAQWSPDGAHIAFTLITDVAQGREYHIAWVPPEGGTPQLYSASGDEHEPTWSADGRWLAYIAYEERAAGADIYSTAEPTAVPPPGQAGADIPLLREADLWVVSADAASKYRLTFFDVGSVHAPRWSPDTNLIGFIYSPSASNDQFWIIANQPGSIPTQLSQQWALILDNTWLPDSSAIVSSVRDIQETSDNRLWRIPLVGNADTDAVPFLRVPELGYADYPRFSPDGRWLALRSAYALALVDQTDNSWQLIDTLPLANTPPVWSPAGFSSEADCL